jgi:hypothetical protein
MADVSTLQIRLAEAELAFHRLATGSAEAEVTQDGITVKYSQASREGLNVYLASLRDQLSAQGITDATALPRRRPLYAAL